jgi:Holliday junction DNA helicase RuvA
VYDFLRGEVVERRPTHLVLDVGGVGYRLTIPLSSYERLPGKGEVLVYAHLYVREDVQRLYGFATRDERKLFELLQTVSGIGPTVALGIVGTTSLEDFRTLVVGENVPGLTRMKGVGKKLALRMVVELKDVLRVLPAGEEPTDATPEAIGAGTAYEDAMLALLALGYTRASSEKALARAMKQLPDATDTSELVRAALAHAG